MPVSRIPTVTRWSPPCRPWCAWGALIMSMPQSRPSKWSPPGGGAGSTLGVPLARLRSNAPSFSTGSGPLARIGAEPMEMLVATP